MTNCNPTNYVKIANFCFFNLSYFQTNNRTKAQQRTAKLVIDKALEEDATIFQYDEVYDDMEKKKENIDEKKKKVDKKVRIFIIKYKIYNLFNIK